MALAGYGNPENYRGFFRLLIHPEDDGSYSMPLIASGDLKALLIDNLGQPRKPKDPIEKRHQDIAAALQEALQETVLHVLQHLRKETNISMLCMAGGVALNSVLNGAIAKSGLFDDIFVQPASSDEGSSLGAAYYAYMQKYSGQCHRMPKLDQVYLGPSYRKSEIVKSLEVFANHLTWKYTKNLCEAIASEIASGKVVGWFQGRMEFGPRALGNRSILADPRPSGMRDRINQKIKHREEFRPFAPAILEEDAEAFFQMNGLRSSPFMLFVVPVRKEQRASIPAVVHVDGTARIQTVSRRTNGKFWHLLAEFKKLTGFPVILNTSFNVMNEPIVCTPTDAIRCYLSTDIDLLVLGNYVVKKRGSSRVFSF
jgi:carbamoyltransferase